VAKGKDDYFLPWSGIQWGSTSMTGPRDSAAAMQRRCSKKRGMAMASRARAGKEGRVETSQGGQEDRRTGGQGEAAASCTCKGRRMT
jgi:hypothetical protein